MFHDSHLRDVESTIWSPGFEFAACSNQGPATTPGALAATQGLVLLASVPKLARAAGKSRADHAIDVGVEQILI